MLGSLLHGSTEMKVQIKLRLILIFDFFFQREKALLSTGHLHRALKIAWNPLRVVLESLSNSIHMNRPDDRKWEGFLSPQDLSKELPVASRPSLTST